jgi:hypothetical protein
LADQHELLMTALVVFGILAGLWIVATNVRTCNTDNSIRCEKFCRETTSVGYAVTEGSDCECKISADELLRRLQKAKIAK